MVRNRVVFVGIPLIVVACGGVVNGSGSTAVTSNGGSENDGWMEPPVVGAGGQAGNSGYPGTGGYYTGTGGYYAGTGGGYPYGAGGGLSFGGAPAGGFGGYAPEGGALCAETNDTAMIEVQQYGATDGGVPSFGNGDVDQTLTGMIQQVNQTQFTVARCAGSSCDGLVWAVTVAAPGLDLRTVLQVGHLARVNYVHVPHAPNWDSYVSTTDILVTDPNLAPTADATTIASLYFAADQGGGLPGYAPYILSYLPTTCPSTGSCSGEFHGQAVHQAYSLDVPVGTPTPLDATMGQTVSTPGTNGLLTLRDLSSYNTTSCEGVTNSVVAYWITNERYRAE